MRACTAGCSAAWEAACREWEGGMREVRESCAKLDGLLRDYGGMGAGAGANSEGSPREVSRAAAEELSRALATGVIGGALLQYITTTLGESCALPRLQYHTRGTVLWTRQYLSTPLGEVDARVSCYAPCCAR